MKIYQANVKVRIRRCIRKGKFESQDKTLDMVYKDGEEKNKNSYFLSCIEKELDIRFDKKEDYKITEIIKIKSIGLNYNE